uniref:hypothetical protein n=1 Tax=Ilumatobacter nonamiensis TaxID=467093 RepID=UPI00058D863B
QLTDSSINAIEARAGDVVSNAQSAETARLQAAADAEATAPAAPRLVDSSINAIEARAAETSGGQVQFPNAR